MNVFFWKHSEFHLVIRGSTSFLTQVSACVPTSVALVCLQGCPLKSCTEREFHFKLEQCEHKNTCLLWWSKVVSFECLLYDCLSGMALVVAIILTVGCVECNRWTVSMDTRWTDWFADSFHQGVGPWGWVHFLQGSGNWLWQSPPVLYFTLASWHAFLGKIEWVQTDFLCSKAFNWSEICTLYVPRCQTQIHINNRPGRLPGLLCPSSVLLKPWSHSTQNLRCVLCRCLSVSQMFSVKMSILQSIAPLHVDHFSSGLFLAWWLQYGAGLQLAESRMVNLVLI